MRVRARVQRDLGDGSQRRLARLALVAAPLLLDRDGQPLRCKVGGGGREVNLEYRGTHGRGAGIRTEGAGGEVG